MGWKSWTCLISTLSICAKNVGALLCRGIYVGVLISSLSILSLKKDNLTVQNCFLRILWATHIPWAENHSISNLWSLPTTLAILSWKATPRFQVPNHLYTQILSFSWQPFWYSKFPFCGLSGKYSLAPSESFLFKTSHITQMMTQHTLLSVPNLYASGLEMNSLSFMLQCHLSWWWGL